MDTNQSIRAPQAMPKRSIEFSEALKQEMALTAETLNEPLTELKVAGYLEALSSPPMRVEQIRNGFRRARRTLKWFPKPMEVRELSILEAEDAEPLRRLPEAHTELNIEERQKWLAKMGEVAKKLAL